MNQRSTQSRTEPRSGIRVAVLLAISCFALSGCSGAPDGKYEVSGNVTWNGEPLESGFISFTPLDSQQATEAGEIHDGRFSFYARPGRNRVEIRATKEAGYNEAMRQPNFVQFLPAEYNVESQLVEEVVEGGENAYEIQLTGQDAK